MVTASAYSPNRLTDFLSFTQRFRVGLVLLGLGWSVALAVLSLASHSGKPGAWLMAGVLALDLVAVLLLPRAAAWWKADDRRSEEHFYAALLALDTLVVCLGVALTGGVNSITFICFYFLAVGNCFAFRRSEWLWANLLMSICYVTTLALIPAGPGAPTAANWVDILLVRCPMMFVVAGAARWLARRGDRAVTEDQTTYLETLKGFLQALEARDGYTRQHSVNVASWAVTFARYLHLPEADVAILQTAGELHDIGKIGTPDHILKKPGRLTPDEFGLMQEHPLTGERIAQHVRWFTPQHLGVIRHHHERWDGKGYPDRLAGEEIPQLARIVSLCDVFDALVSDRPYRSGSPARTALTAVIDGRGTQFDPALADQFLRFMAELESFLRNHMDVISYGSPTWMKDEVRILVRTPEGQAHAWLRWYGTGWDLLKVEAVPQAVEVVS